MYCRFCGAKTPADSRFCPRCGKRIADATVRTDGFVQKLGPRLRTPYPWAGILLAAFLWWAFVSTGPEPFDYGAVAVSIELDGTSSAPEASLYRQHFNVVVENVGAEPIVEVPVELRAGIQVSGPARIDSEFRGQRVALFADGVAEPLDVILTDDLEPGGKRRYPMDGLVTATPPFQVWYELLDRQTGEVLAVLSHSEPGPEPGPDTAAR